MPSPPVIASGISAGAGLLGAGKQSAQQQQASGAASQAFGAEESVIKQMLSQFATEAPLQEQALVNQYGAQNTSLISTLRDQLGGVANPGNVLQSMTAQGDQSKMQLAQSLQSQMAQEKQRALESAMGGLQGIGSIYAGAAGQGGNPWTSAIGGLGNFINTLGSSNASTGTGGLGNISSYTPTFNPVPLTGPSYEQENLQALGGLSP